MSNSALNIRNWSWLDTVILCFGTLLFVGVAKGFLREGFFDDSYITFQYARNFANGKGLVWDPAGPPIEGFTSVSWVLLLGAVSRLFSSDIPRTAELLGLAMGSGTLWLSWLTLRGLGASSAWQCLSLTTLLALTPEFVRHSLSGMETLLVALALLSLSLTWCYAECAKGRRLYWAWLGTLSFLATLTRPDAAIFAIVGSSFLLWRLRAERSNWLAMIVSFIAPTLITEFARRAYFNEWLPLPAYMKLRPSVLFDPALLHFILGHWLGYFGIVASALILFALAKLNQKRLSSAGLAQLLAATIYAMYFLSVLPIMSIHYRFLIPTYPLFAILGVWSLGSLATLERHTQRNPTLFALFALFAAQHVGRFPPIKTECAQWANGHQLYGEIGRRLQPFKGMKIACSEVGELAWYSEIGIIDLSGLNDPFVAKGRFADPDFARSFLEHITRSPPDVYIDPPPEYGYASFSRLYALHDRYEKHAFGPLSLYILRSSPFSTRARAALTVRQSSEPAQ